MSAATNPFAAALEAHKDDERAAPPAQPSSPVTRHNPHNPFANAVAASASSPPASPSTNPFRTTSPARAPTAAATSNAYTVPDSSNATYSADAITQSLSGLDFGAGTAFAPPPPPAAVPAQAHFDTQPSAATPDHAPHTATEPSAMTTVYAPPPGPPPGHPDAAALEQVRQMEADEAYARQVFARDQEREQRRAQRHQQRSSGAGESASSVAATTAMAQDRQTQKRRQQSYDPALAAVGGAPAPHHAASPGPAIDPRAPLPPTLGAVDHTNGTRNTATTEKQWNTKEIYWQGRSQRVVVQNENGPCSLIALCNVLLMRGSVQITPADRPAVSYEYLSSMLGEHLIDVISTQPGEALDLEAALSILPQTQYGLDVNVKFSSIDGFAVEEEESSNGNLVDDGTVAAGSSSAAANSAPTQQSKSEKAATQRGELALFKLCNVPLVHGWLVDPADKETWEAVITRAGGHYDGALDRVVAGDELTKGMVVESSGSDQAALDNLSSSDKQVVQDALLIRRFLESTATQLTYPGLYALSTTLQRGSLYALFRNSHLSVLYRPTEHELAQGGGGDAPPSHDQPQLYQLVTDATLENEDGIVWESVEDVDGSASRFYDGKFRPAQVQNDFVGQRRSDGDGGGPIDQDADFAYAQHLQEQEHVRADRHRRTADMQRRQRTQQQQQQQQQQSGNAGGGLIARMLANRKANKRAPSSQAVQQNVAEQNGALNSGNGEHGADGYHEPPPSSAPSNPQYGDAEELPQRGDKKWWKKVF